MIKTLLRSYHICQFSPKHAKFQKFLHGEQIKDDVPRNLVFHTNGTQFSFKYFSCVNCVWGMKMFVCLCLTSHRQRGHSETAPPFTVPCEGREAR